MLVLGSMARARRRDVRSYRAAFHAGRISAALVRGIDAAVTHECRGFGALELRRGPVSGSDRAFAPSQLTHGCHDATDATGLRRFIPSLPTSAPAHGAAAVTTAS